MNQLLRTQPAHLVRLSEAVDVRRKAKYWPTFGDLFTLDGWSLILGPIGNTDQSIGPKPLLCQLGPGSQLETADSSTQPDLQGPISGKGKLSFRS